MTILESIQLVHAYQPSSICSSDLQREHPNISQEVWLSKQSTKLHFAWSFVEFDLPLILPYCYIHLQVLLSIYILTQWIFRVKEEILSPSIAALLVELITVGMGTYDACAKRIGTKDPSLAVVPSNPLLFPLVSYPNHDTAGTHNWSGASTSTTLSRSLFFTSQSLPERLHCHPLSLSSLCH